MSTNSLDMAYVTQQLATKLNKLAIARMFPPDEEGETFEQLESMPVLGEVEFNPDPLKYEPLRNFAPLRRLLSAGDEALLLKSPGAMENRRRLVWHYCSEIERDAYMLCQGNKIVARSMGWDMVEVLAWRTMTYRLIQQIRITAVLHRYGIRRAPEFLENSAAALQVIMEAAKRQLDNALPTGAL